MSTDDFNIEPLRGLPERLPDGEHILWQGAPNPMALARDALMVCWVAGYFILLAVWRFGATAADVPLATAIAHGLTLVIAGAVTCLILFDISYAQARATMCTIAIKRVAVRIGAALTMTLNLPFVCIGGAQLDQRARGTGMIAFQLPGETRLSCLMTWPHVRPWVIARTQPALRCIADAAAVAQIFAEAAETRVGQPQVTRATHDNRDGAPFPAE